MAGSYNPLVAAIKPSAIRTMHERKRNSSIDLGMGQPTLAPDLEPFEKAMGWVREHGAGYPPNAGLGELREHVARLYGGYYNPSATNVCVTNGSQEGIYLAVKALLKPGSDEMLVTDPCYASYVRCCQLEGISWRAVRLSEHDGFSVNADRLLEALTPATRLIMLGSPANPTATVLAERELRRLARRLLDRKGSPVWVVVDEVYRELTFMEKPFASLLDHYPYAIALQSLSKSCALTGMRIGFSIGPVDAVAAMVRVHALMLMSVNVFAQQVALAIVKEPNRLRAHYDWYARQRLRLLELAAANDLEILQPQGSFYALLRLPGRWSSSQAAADHLLERYDVVTVPGIVFGEQTERYLRLTWAAQPPDLASGLQRIAEFCGAAS